jgi:hypothetical protein
MGVNQYLYRILIFESKPTASSSPNPSARNSQATHPALSKADSPIMDADMKSYGSFQAEDVASLPELNARILVKQGLAVQVDFIKLLIRKMTACKKKKKGIIRLSLSCFYGDCGRSDCYRCCGNADDQKSVEGGIIGRCCRWS